MQTEITLTNLDDTASTYTLGFFDDNGNSLSLVTNAGLSVGTSGSLEPHASRTFRTAGNSIPPTQGWASIIASGNVGASATFRVSTAPWTGSEVVVPADPARNNRFSLAFDQTDSAVIGLALTNPLAFFITVTLTFRGEDGSVIATDTFPMLPRAHKAITTTSSYPTTAGKRGTIEISTNGILLSVLALRFGRSAITSIEPLVAHTWSNIDNGCPGCWDY